MDTPMGHVYGIVRVLCIFCLYFLSVYALLYWFCDVVNAWCVCMARFVCSTVGLVLCAMIMMCCAQ